MANTTTSFLDEFVSAARGCFALLVGNRQASSYFDFRQTGLVGSFIALMIGLAVQAFGPQLLGHPSPKGIASGLLILSALVLAVQFGAAWLVLRWMGRSDGFVPFIVAQNWVALFQSILAVAIIVFIGEPFVIAPGSEVAQLTSASIPYIVLGIAALVVSVNIARLILTLRPRHVAAFVIAQLLTALFLQPILAALV
ncbi:hypothetical protein WH87_11510 [Devosia epidermidihirudinis]|uniref:Yip1 domain-containing protein n=1 Tax=Devosia epidermidihirudinis TaxID=1293439 RepID=A0A0F5QB41_9HYPH|nr:hypothetical protein [Devosia epidermidihirudinis]KKC38212.1 hypothetical protein WH87_11510 [Devosia epidermidihirudinis]